MDTEREKRVWKLTAKKKHNKKLNGIRINSWQSERTSTRVQIKWNVFFYTKKEEDTNDASFSSITLCVVDLFEVIIALNSTKIQCLWNDQFHVIHKETEKMTV